MPELFILLVVIIILLVNWFYHKNRYGRCNSLRVGYAKCIGPSVSYPVILHSFIRIDQFAESKCIAGADRHCKEIKCRDFLENRTSKIEKAGLCKALLLFYRVAGCLVNVRFVTTRKTPCNSVRGNFLKIKTPPVISRGHFQTNKIFQTCK